VEERVWEGLGLRNAFGRGGRPQKFLVLLTLRGSFLAWSMGLVFCIVLCSILVRHLLTYLIFVQHIAARIPYLLLMVVTMGLLISWSHPLSGCGWDCRGGPLDRRLRRDKSHTIDGKGRGGALLKSHPLPPF
jgi:hypothetical protein